MTRKLTEYELNILRLKCPSWSYGLEVKNGLIELGNGQNDDVTAYLPYELLMNNHINLIGNQHVLSK